MFPGFEAFLDCERGDDTGGRVGATPATVAADVKAQKAVSAESAIRVGLPSARLAPRLAIARAAMSSRAAPVPASPWQAWRWLVLPWP